MHFRDKIMFGLAPVILLSKSPGHVDCRHVLPQSVVTVGSFPLQIFKIIWQEMAVHFNILDELFHMIEICHCVLGLLSIENLSIMHKALGSHRITYWTAEM